MLSLPCLLLLAAVSSSTPAFASLECNGVREGNICLSNCQGRGLYVKAPSLISSITIPTFKVEFDPNNPWEPKATAAGIEVKVKIPDALKSMTMTFTGAGSSIDLGLPGGSLVANLYTPDYAPASGDSNSQVINLSLSNTPLSVKNNDKNGFADFFKATTLQSGPVNVHMTGYANTKAIANNKMAMKALSLFDASAKSLFARDGGNLNVCLQYVPFDVTAQLTGLGGLTQTSIKGLPVVKGGSAEKGIELSINLEIVNPSNIIMNANTDAIFDLFYESQKVATVTIPNISLNQGVNHVVANSFVYPDPQDEAAVAAARKLLSAFTGGIESDVVVSRGRASNMPSLDAAFGALNLPQTLPPNHENLIQSSKFTFPNPFTMKANAGLIGYNPFDAPIKIIHVSASLSYRNDSIGLIDCSIENFEIPPRSAASSPAMPLSLKLDFTAIRALFATMSSSLRVKVTTSMTVDFGGYITIIDYVQNDVVTSLAWRI